MDTNVQVSNSAQIAQNQLLGDVLNRLGFVQFLKSKNSYTAITLQPSEITKEIENRLLEKGNNVFGKSL